MSYSDFEKEAQNLQELAKREAKRTKSIMQVSEGKAVLFSMAIVTGAFWFAISL